VQEYQARVAALLIEAEADLRRRLRTAGDLDDLEAAARGTADRLAADLVEMLVEQADQVLQQGRPRGWRVIGQRVRTVVSTVGPLRLRRTLYRDGKGRARFLLDEELKLAPKVRTTPRLQAIAVELCSRMPFRVAADTLLKLLPSAPRPVTLHRLVAQVGDRRRQEGEALRRQVFEQGIACAGERRVARLFVEADGKWVHLQRTPQQRDLELFVGVAHEGWEAESADRWRLREKQVHIGLPKSEAFWEVFSARLAQRYDLSRTRVVVNGDGADWVRHGAGYFRRATTQLDRFHLARALRVTFPGPEWRAAYKAVCRGDLLPAVRALVRSPHAEAPRVIQYLENNREALRDYRLRDGFAAPDLRGLGAGEANVDKLVANRMCKRGMAWTIAGAQRMTTVLEASHNGVLGAYVPRPTAASSRRRPLRNFFRTHDANAALAGASAEEVWRHAWAVGGNRGFASILRRMGRPSTLWEQN